MNTKEEETGKRYRGWTDIVDIVRKELNEHRHKKLKSFNPDDYPPVSIDRLPKFEVGDIVYEKLDHPENALGNKQDTSQFRTGDYRFSRVPKKIIKVIVMRDEPIFRYILESKPNGYKKKDAMWIKESDVI
eukprot:scaffold478_cov203-Ochromonas_danica.AAC.1